METLINFRGLNDFTTLDNKKIKPNLIFRSGELVNINAIDQKELFDNLNIKRIYDFRSTKEIDEKPDDVFENVTYRHLDLMRDSGKHTSSLEEFSRENATKPDDIMKKMYRDIFLNKSGREGLHNFLSDLSINDQPAIFHCFAGKDRTGVAAALFLNALKVPKKEVMQDYLKTNVSRKKSNDMIIKELKKQGVELKVLNSVETMLYVKQSYLEHGFSLVKENFGSIENYVKAKDGLDLPNSVLLDLQGKYLV